jgi:hypothetical protein
MKIFFYKSVIVFFLFLLAFHFSFNYASKKISGLVNEKISKDSIEIIKENIREEVQTAIQKDDYIKPEDAKLINQFLNKIRSDLEKNK